MITDAQRPGIELKLARGATDLSESLAASGAVYALDDWCPGPDIGVLAGANRWPDRALRVHSSRRNGRIVVFASPSDSSSRAAYDALSEYFGVALVTDARVMDLTVGLKPGARYSSEIWYNCQPIAGYVFLSAPDCLLPSVESFQASEWAAAFWSALAGFAGLAINRPGTYGWLPTVPAPITLDKTGAAQSGLQRYILRDGGIKAHEIRYLPEETGELWILNGAPVSRKTRMVLRDQWLVRIASFVDAYGVNFAHAKVSNREGVPTLLGISTNPFLIAEDDEVSWLAGQLAAML